ncbi:MAG: MFS transporter [Anaerosomatales bacterium]|nr:MFS transporter [Anaerosomatales bacterium]MDT8434478.1 MFS transporter [Anaerosomatales bacterium]
MGQREPSSRQILVVYLASGGFFTLAASLIWGVNTLFLLDAGLDIFQVMLVNAAFSAGQVLFEVPTGVIADTIGRKASYLLGLASLLVATLLYMASAEYAWGFWAFVGASVLLGFGFTCQTGAVDAWMVDALNFLEYEGLREQVFARAGMVSGAAMLVGTLSGGFLGQVNLSVPYLVRSGILGLAFVFVLFTMREVGFTPRALKLSRFGAETRVIFNAGIQYGWRHRVVRPMLFVSAVQGVFMLYFFYSMAPFALDLLGRPDLVWVAGVLAALFGLAGIGGNALVGPVMRSKSGRRRPSSVLAVMAVLTAVSAAAIGVIGLLAPEGGSLIAFALAIGIGGVFWGVFFGVMQPIAQAYLNEHIPSAQRATVLSVASFFSEAGGMAGQPALGWIARATSIPVGYLVGAVFMGVAAPLYRMAGRGEGGEGGMATAAEEVPVAVGEVAPCVGCRAGSD